MAVAPKVSNVKPMHLQNEQVNQAAVCEHKH